jgi:CO/xanthine dehydrogenase Mo-binding subunit
MPAERNETSEFGEMTVQKILRGRSVFIEDIMDKDALVIKVKRAAVARGKIRGMIFPELPADVTIIRARDIPGRNSLSVFGVEAPILSAGEVSYKGEPVLLLVGPDEQILDDLIEQIVIDYEEDKAEFSFEYPKPENIFYTRRIERGKIGKKFEEAFQVLDETFSAGMQEHYYSEPHGVYIRWNADTCCLEVLSSSRWPFHVHATLCEVLALPRELISVTAPESPDRSLGGKLWYPSLMAAHAALAAWLTKRNIKAFFTREEDFLYTPKSAPAIFRYKVALDTEGNLSAAEIKILINLGAYAMFGREISDRAAFAALGGYRCADVRLEVSAVRTNLPPMGAFNGMGTALGFFAAESMAERIRDLAQIDLIEWKKVNLLCKNTEALSGILPRNSLPEPELFNMAVRVSDFNRKHAAFELARKRRSSTNRLPDYFRGIGIALGCQGSGFFGAGEENLTTSLELAMDTDGKVQISQSVVPGSYALHEIWRSIAAESLGAERKDVYIAPVYTESGRDSGPSVFSRGITIVTKLVEDCCDLLKKKRFRSPLPLNVSKTFRLPQANAWDDAAFSGCPFIDMSWAVSVVELRIEPLTLIPEIAGIWMFVDGGKILNPEEARKSLETAINCAIGWAMFEHISYEDGAIPREQFSDYRIPSSCDVPTPRIEFFDEAGKRPVKGIGELAQACVPAAYVNALAQALGIPFSHIPIPLESKRLSKEVPL